MHSNKGPFLLPTNHLIFPSADLADEQGLLAVGGSLDPKNLLIAYQQGIFPWFSNGDPILWWSPDPRLIIQPEKFKLRKSLFKRLKQLQVTITINQTFDQVIQHCSEPRYTQTETWISHEMQIAYQKLHQKGHCHSIEVWSNQTSVFQPGNTFTFEQNDLFEKPNQQGYYLIGGLYGVKVGNIFCGESMFSQVKDASKIALAALCYLALKEKDTISLIDCQVENPHLFSLGAETIQRSHFLAQLAQAKAKTHNNSHFFDSNVPEKQRTLNQSWYHELKDLLSETNRETSRDTN